MNVVGKHGVRGAAAMAPIARPAGSNMSAMTLKHGFRTVSRPWLCQECKQSRILPSKAASMDSVVWRRSFSRSRSLLDEVRKPSTPNVNAKPPQEQFENEEPPPISPPSSLPSKIHQRRWLVSKRMARMMDKMLARAFVWGQHINVYTGTDYSGIETLRKDIDAQEQKMKEAHEEIDAARDIHHEAHAKQAASQKEIVSLLERKSSWSPEDLERYMSLVRSEHTDEQAVQRAKDGLNEAERDLENARADLERLERKQYHEEQIWSDTIRRNSTWVTFGLMGVNIVLLLAQIMIFEPYRRRKIVRDVNQALDEKALFGPPPPVERQIDQAIEPKGVTLETVENATMPQQPLDAFVPVQHGLQNTVLPSGEVFPAAAAATPRQSDRPNTSSGRWEQYKESLQDLFSERIIEVKKVDITNKALQGAATGVAAMGLLFVLWRPK